ncbi:ABC1 family protein C10F6.14c [Cyphellophora attinorum]|uniref:ABC1 family protein C10F6.14c n=1 Tax=Cyphellophora attinorum TaxID=1664694 RepID=A0A0N0NHK9_9EURO|nr:ABC1 family protein C10F6.14c [Phialophora attinorum]KPI34389.1 ABC1 family protein C10F6.14c [Phialophora attinorum]
MASASRRICDSCLAAFSKSTRSQPLSPLRSSISRSRPFHSTQYRAAFAPPSPESLGKARPAREYKRTRRWLRRLGYLTVAGGIGYVIDNQFFASALTRSTRTFALGLTVALDYKINFRENPPFADDITEVHARNAEKLSNLLRKNGGLYLKIGQAIAMQSAILPPEFQKMFSTMFDDAPQNDWTSVRRVIMEDFNGRTPEEVFGVSFSNNGDPTKGVMERKARASASVAQVHWARLPDGREVAIKIQKEEISKQVGWDLWAFKVVARVYSWYFDLPFYTLVPYITERLKLECDFTNEAANSRRMAEFVAAEPRLRDRVYIPKVYDDLTSKRVMTAEWIEGHGTPLDPPKQSTQHLQSASASSPGADLKPDRNYWRGVDGQGGLGLSLSEVMTTMVSLFSAQMFMWGWVHCDPHPGNIFIRRLPSGHSELVLIDHGLYISMSPKFRHEYSLFWKSMMTFDNGTMGRVAREWGVNDSELFASATLMRPYQGGQGRIQKKFAEIGREEDAKKRHYEMQQASRQAVREILSDENKWPKELIFIGRNMRIVQGNNQYLGSPVNRIKITGNWASRALADNKDLKWSERWRYWASHMVFKVVLLGTDVAWWVSRVRQWFGKGKGMDDDMEQQMKKIAEGYGVKMQHDVFEG